MRQRIVTQFIGVAAALSVAGLAFAQSTQPQTAPGTVPVPKPGEVCPRQLGAGALQGDCEEVRAHSEHQALC